MMSVIQVPSLAYGMAFEEKCEKDGYVESQVAPNQSVAGPVNSSSFHRRKDPYELEDQRSLRQPYRRSIDKFKRPAELHDLNT